SATAATGKTALPGRWRTPGNAGPRRGRPPGARRRHRAALAVAGPAAGAPSVPAGPGATRTARPALPSRRRWHVPAAPSDRLHRLALQTPYQNNRVRIHFEHSEPTSFSESHPSRRGVTGPQRGYLLPQARPLPFLLVRSECT